MTLGALITAVAIVLLLALALNAPALAIATGTPVVLGAWVLLITGAARR